MKVLVVGSGAREHALAVALLASGGRPILYGYGAVAHPALVALSADWCTGDPCDVRAVVRQAQAWAIDLVLIGPEAPLAAGLADGLQAAGMAVVGPVRALARLESSKCFARDLMQRHGIAGLPRYRFFDSLAGVADWLVELKEDWVIKADGLAGGRGVRVSGDHLHSTEEALAFCNMLIQSGKNFLIEEKCSGQEFSLMAFCDGKTIAFMPLVQDNKRAFPDDRGPNTGGMGSCSDANHSLPFLSAEDVLVAKAILREVLFRLQEETGETWHGILYGSFMATRNGVVVIEFNARFGDPEVMNVLSVLETDFLQHCIAMTEGTLSVCPPRFASLATVCKYAVPEGYPDHPLSGHEILMSDCPAGVRYLGDVRAAEEKLYTGTSRTVAAVGVAQTLAAAERSAEAVLTTVQGPLYHREDIGTVLQMERRTAHMRELRQSVVAGEIT